MFTIYGERYKNCDPLIDPKTKEVLDDGSPKRVSLGQWSNKKVAESMSENIKNNVPKRSWKIWIEETS